LLNSLRPLCRNVTTPPRMPIERKILDPNAECESQIQPVRTPSIHMKIAIGIGIGIGIELLKTDPDSDSDPDPDESLYEAHSATMKSLAIHTLSI
jgi:hypothetical protein